jgi:hypothetical protein
MYAKVYLILAHKKPEQIAVLISLLQDGNSYFFIHLDKKINIKLFETIRQMERCFFIEKRKRSRWGGFNLVQATINGMKEIQSYMNINHSLTNYHCIFLSGEDLPIQTNADIHNFLEGKKEYSFIHHWKLPYDKWWGGGLFRFESLFIFNFIKYRKAHYWLNRIIDKLNFNFVFAINKLKKDYPNIDLYGSSQWMILSKKMINSIIDTSLEKKEFKQIFKYVFAPDELYIITLIKNFIKNENLLIVNSATHLVRFKGVSANPEYISISDVENNKTCATLFARKFDNEINGDTISYIQNFLRN